MVFGFIFQYFYKLCFLLGLFSLYCILSYLVPILITTCLTRKRNLRAYYKSKWALVTGGSTGIGKCLCEKLLEMDLNLILIALDDEHLKATQRELQRKTSKLVIPVGVDLSKVGYMEVIKKTCQSLDIGIIFNNVGYTVFGEFRDMNFEKIERNLECNMMSYLRITHYFLQKWRDVDSREKGLICFTNSCATVFPTPYVATYGGSKSFIQHFAKAIAIENGKDGVDVLCFNPELVKTNVLDGSKFAPVFKDSKYRPISNIITSDPKKVVERMLRAASRRDVVFDSGIFTVAPRILLSFSFDGNLFAKLVRFVYGGVFSLIKRMKKKSE